MLEFDERRARVGASHLGPHRLAAQDVALSRPKHEFETRWGHNESAEEADLCLLEVSQRARPVGCRPPLSASRGPRIGARFPFSRFVGPHNLAEGRTLHTWTLSSLGQSAVCGDVARFRASGFPSFRHHGILSTSGFHSTRCILGGIQPIPYLGAFAFEPGISLGCILPDVR